MFLISYKYSITSVKLDFYMKKKKKKNVSGA